MKAKEVFNHALALVGTPYFYGCKNWVLSEAFMAQMHKLYPKTVTLSYMAKARRKKLVGKKCIDCSGVIADATGINWGSSQLYSKAKARLSVKEYQKWATGVVVWRQGHVGVFGWVNGQPVVVEAKGIDYGTVISPFKPSQWSYGLTFDFLTYEYVQTVVNKTSKGSNPYDEPKENLKKGSKGDGVKWLQYELIEAGYDLGKGGDMNKGIDGDFGKKTDKALRAFQRSAKLVEDGICGKKTRDKLKG